MRKLLALLCLLALTACSQKYALDSYQSPPQRLANGSAIYVMVPENGQYSGRPYANSGEATARALVASLSRVTNKVESGAAPESVDAARAAARSKGVAYVFQPLILNWTDRATEWSGIPDRITIKVVVYDAESGKDIASIMGRASSKWGTVGGDHPQDLLPKIMDEFTKKLF
jgi:hypothetical protein